MLWYSLDSSVSGMVPGGPGFVGFGHGGPGFVGFGHGALDSGVSWSAEKESARRLSAEAKSPASAEFVCLCLESQCMHPDMRNLEPVLGRSTVWSLERHHDVDGRGGQSKVARKARLVRGGMHV